MSSWIRFSDTICNDVNFPANLSGVWSSVPCLLQPGPDRGQPFLILVRAIHYSLLSL